MTAESRRWSWVNGFCTAALHAVLRDGNIAITRSLTFPDACQQFVRAVAQRYEYYGRPALPPIHTLSDEETHYLFHLESELWGPDWQVYLRFFPEQSGKAAIWQTFHFALAFYLVERWLYVFMPPDMRQASRGGRRRFLFGVENGVFSVSHREALGCLGVPFSIVGETRRGTGIDERSGRVLRSLRNTGSAWVPESLVRFYYAATGKRSPGEILEAGFVGARRDLRKRLKLRRRAPQRARAWWYDALWKYSESVRYNPLGVGHVETEDAFYWNRSIRWLTALTVTGLMWMATRQPAGARIVRKWEEG